MSDEILPRYANVVLLPLREPIEWVDTTEIVPRPVTARMMRRLTGNPLPPPSDLEKHHAIIVLAAGRQYDDDPLFDEAQRILDEASG